MVEIQNLPDDILVSDGFNSDAKAHFTVASNTNEGNADTQYFAFLDALEEGYEQIDNQEKENEQFRHAAKQLNSDADSIHNQEFLNNLKDLSPQLRLVLLSIAAHQIYIGANDFEDYFNAFPQDAAAVVASIWYEEGLGQNPAYYLFIMGYKVLEPAAKRVPGAMEQVLNKAQSKTSISQIDFEKCLQVSEYSKLARQSLLENQPNDYKLAWDEKYSIAKYGEDLSKATVEYLKRLGRLSTFQEWGIVDPNELFKHSDFISLPADAKGEFIKDLIADCHNAVVHEEVYNSTRGIEEVRSSPIMAMRGMHSIIHRTPHNAQNFSKKLYLDFVDSPYSDQPPGGEHDWESTIESSIKQIAQITDLTTAQRQQLNDFLFYFWSKNGDPAYGPALASTMSKLGPDLAVTKILSDLPKIDGTEQKKFLSLLYRLELGRVGISEDGLNYLGRRFDLGQYNRPDYFAQRLTAKGVVGIFDQDREIIGAMNLQANQFTMAQTDAIKAELYEITSEMLFAPHPDETDQEKAEREQVLAEFKAGFFDTYLNGEFRDRSGLTINNMDLPEQAWAVKHLRSTAHDLEKTEGFYQFIRQFGEDGFYALRSAEFDASAPASLLRVNEKFGTELSKTILAEYRRTYQLAEAVSRRVTEMLAFQDSTLESALVRENILRFAQVYLTSSETFPLDNANPNHPKSLFFLRTMNHELEMFLQLPATPQGFMDGQIHIGRFIQDHASDSDAKSPEYLSSDAISNALKKLYQGELDPSFDLRNYEGKTTDTALSLANLIPEIGDADLMATADGYNAEHPEQTKLTIEDWGAGNLRMAIPLALLGHQVRAMDIAPKMLEDGVKRIKEFKRNYDAGFPDLLIEATTNAFATAQRKIDPFKVPELEKRISLRQGDYHQPEQDENGELVNRESADVIIIMWHTLLFAGDEDGVLQVLKNAFDKLRPGGKLIFEIPDRNMAGYAHAWRDYKKLNPTVPAGTLVDAPSANSGQATEQNSVMGTPRYFLGQDQLLGKIDQLTGGKVSTGLIEDAGFSFNDVRTYFVNAGEKDKPIISIKEQMYVAEKPLAGKYATRLTDYAQTLVFEPLHTPN
jgi:SAM-dependent methyltransferase